MQSSVSRIPGYTLVTSLLSRRSINEFAGGVLPDAETLALGPCAFLPPAHTRVVSTPVKTAQSMMVPKSVIFASFMPSGIIFQDLISDIFE